MWHPVKRVAETYRLPADTFDEFARGNSEKYGIVVDSDGAEVNTWHVDNLVRDFQEKLADHCAKP